MERGLPVQAFSFGYDGWGNATKQLVEAVDAVEKSRGSQPAIFIDVRLQRSVRAVGFTGNAFAEVVGASRYTWMKKLGNKRIATRTGPDIQISDPDAAEALLDRVLLAAEEERRVIFFCSCRFPRGNSFGECHRCTVASLLLEAAERRRVALEVVEWPGCGPTSIELSIDPETFNAVRKGRKSVPLSGPLDLPAVAGLSWGSLATLQSGAQHLYRLIGPVRWQAGRWVLPLTPEQPDDLDGSRTAFEEFQVAYRQKYGMESRSAVDKI